MWLWNNVEQLIDIGEVPNRVDKVLVASGLVSTVSEATRLIKGNGVRMKSWLTWEQVTDPRAEIPTGKPVLLRVGKSSWRLVKREERPGWEGFPTWRDVMFPTENQEFEFWSQF